MSTETEFHTPRQFKVGILFNGQEKFLGTYIASSKDQAKEQCRKEVRHAEEFNLWAKEVEE